MEDQSLAIYDQRIHDNQLFVAKKLSEIQVTVKSNAFLERVLTNYQKYYDAMVHEKQEQLRALNIVKKYLTEVATAEDALEKSQEEQEILTEEIKQVSGMLEALIREKQ